MTELILSKLNSLDEVVLVKLPVLFLIDRATFA